MSDEAAGIMQSHADNMKGVIDKFQERIGTIFSEFMLSTACTKAGLGLISQGNPTNTVSLMLAQDLFTEPMTFAELLQNKRELESRSIAHYQNMMIASWSDSIQDLFKCLLEMHFKGVRKFTELKKQNVKLDLSIDISIETQAVDMLLKDFSFWPYPDRFKLINQVLNPSKDLDSESLNIRKHVLIRNAIQHHNSVAYQNMFDQLGVKEFDVFDDKGVPFKVTVDNVIYMSVPEFDRLKRDLYLLSQKWRSHCA